LVSLINYLLKMVSDVYQPSDDSWLMKKVLEEILPSLLEENSELKFLEIGCGSGIQLKTASEIGLKKRNIFGVDINHLAVRECKKLRFNCVESDLFCKVEGKFNVIIFNPPYLPEDSREPKISKLATTGGKKGSEIINRFLEQAGNFLEEKGIILLLTSSLTKGIKWNGWKKRKIQSEKVFFETLYVFEIFKKNFMDERFRGR